MANPQLNIGNLDFSDIKKSLKTYLSNQDTLKDYDYEGSVISTLLDLLSYNTMYYAFYSNMIANEMFLDSAQKISSLISLAKPLGYVVPGATSARAVYQILFGGGNITIPRFHKFIGTDENGRSYNFYTINEAQTDGTGNAEIELYEGSNFYDGVQVTLNEDRTRAFISRTDIDIRTLVVNVDGGEWQLSSNVNDQINSESEVYFLERTDAGFYIIFSGNISDGINVGYGKPLPENAIVTVSYLTSSGTVGNGINSFTTDWTDTDIDTNALITRTVFASGGGSLEPDIDAVKFFAPKWFSSQDRVVTKNDAIAILTKELLPGLDDSDTKLSVWGGEENDPPYYGRFFVSLLGDNESDMIDGETIVTALNVLKQKCVVTVLPEYVGPNLSTMIVKMNGTSIQSRTNKSVSVLEAEIATALNSEFGGSYRFNKEITSFDIQRIALSVDPSLNIEPSSISSTHEINFSLSQNIRYFSFKNPIKIQTGTINSRSVQSTPTLGYLGYTDLQVVDSPTNIDSSGWAPLYLVRYVNGSYTYVTENARNVIAGRVNYERGLVEIYAGMMIQPFTLKLVPQNVTFRAKQELILNPTFQVSITAEA